jgi:selenium metabolism protein YedF
MIKLDYSQHKCPYPVVETRKQMLANPGSPLIVTVGDQAGRDNVSRLAEKMGYTSSSESAEQGYRLTLKPAATASEGAQQVEKNRSPSAPGSDGKTVVYCGSDRMGQGDDAFGRLLMRNFITTQLEMDPLPDAILFVNSGINLTTAGSEVLEALEKLQDKGVDLASCGLCLDFYEKKEDLRIGRVTNMYEIADLQNSAARVVTP